MNTHISNIFYKIIEIYIFDVLWRIPFLFEFGKIEKILN